MSNDRASFPDDDAIFAALERCGENPDAHADTLDRLQSALTRIARSKHTSGNTHDAEDLASETIVSVLGAWERVRLQAAVAIGGYFRSVLRNKDIDRRRRLRSTRLVIEGDEEVTTATMQEPTSRELTPAEEAERREFMSVLRQRLSASSDKDWTIFRCMSEGASSIEVAEMVALTPEAVRMRIFRIRKALAVDPAIRRFGDPDSPRST